MTLHVLPPGGIDRKIAVGELAVPEMSEKEPKNIMTGDESSPANLVSEVLANIGLYFKYRGSETKTFSLKT